MKDLGSIPTIVFGDRLLLALDRKYMELNNGKSLEFEAKIDDDGKLVLISPTLIKLTSTGVNLDNG